MVASLGALICSGLITAGRHIYGHVDKGVYYPGVRNVAHELIK